MTNAYRRHSAGLLGTSMRRHAHKKVPHHVTGQQRMRSMLVYQSAPCLRRARVAASINTVSMMMRQVAYRPANPHFSQKFHSTKTFSGIDWSAAHYGSPSLQSRYVYDSVTWLPAGVLTLRTLALKFCPARHGRAKYHGKQGNSQFRCPDDQS